jgi:tetratricopeptide (TPR) repeat protein
LREQGDLSAAMTCFERALQISEPFYGTTHPNVVSLLNELARVTREQGDAQGALRYADRALAAQGEGDGA